MMFLLLACALAPEDDDAAPTEGRNAGECADGADNDGDGAYDCDDGDCAAAPDCDASDADTDTATMGCTNPAYKHLHFHSV